MPDPLTQRELLTALEKAHAQIMRDLLRLIAGQVNREPDDEEVVELASSLCVRWEQDETFRKAPQPHGAAVHRLLAAQFDIVKQILTVEDVISSNPDKAGDEPTSH